MRAQLPRLLVATLAAALALGGGARPAAPAVPVGQPQLVSPADGGDHHGPDLALDGAGATVVWQATGDPLAGSDIFARRLGPDGSPIGSPFRVNAAAAGEQRRPAVAGLPGGGFIVAWDTATSTVWARRFGPDGAPLDQADLPISPEDEDSHFDADVVALPGGGFVVAWEHETLVGSGVLLRPFGPDGLAAGPARPPHDPAAGAADRRSPALAAAPDGALAVVWEEEAPPASRVVLSRYDAAGEPAILGAPVAASDADELRDPAVAVGADGTASVAWTRLQGRRPAAGLIELGRIDAAGAPLGPPVTISAPAPAERGAPAVAAGAWGTVAAWSDASGAQGGAPVGLAVRTLSAEGAPTGDELYPRLPAVGGPARVVKLAVGADAAWVVWSQDTVAEGLDVGAVYARLIADAPALAPGDRVYLPRLSKP